MEAVHLEYLDNDELKIEFEIRNITGPSTQSLETLKSLIQKEYLDDISPSKAHEAALQNPVSELRLCREKLASTTDLVASFLQQTAGNGDVPSGCPSKDCIVAKLFHIKGRFTRILDSPLTHTAALRNLRKRNMLLEKVQATDTEIEANNNSHGEDNLDRADILFDDVDSEDEENLSTDIQIAPNPPPPPLGPIHSDSNDSALQTTLHTHSNPNAQQQEITLNPASSVTSNTVNQTGTYRDISTSQTSRPNPAHSSNYPTRPAGEPSRYNSCMAVASSSSNVYMGSRNLPALDSNGRDSGLIHNLVDLNQSETLAQNPNTFAFSRQPPRGTQNGSLPTYPSISNKNLDFQVSQVNTNRNLPSSFSGNQPRVRGPQHLPRYSQPQQPQHYTTTHTQPSTHYTSSAPCHNTFNSDPSSNLPTHINVSGRTYRLEPNNDILPLSTYNTSSLQHTTPYVRCDSNTQPAYPRHISLAREERNLRFRGTLNDISIDKFLYRFECSASSYGIPMERFVSEIKGLLEDYALDFYWSYQENHPFSSWLQLREALRAHFQEGRDDFDIRRMLDNRKQRPRESFEEFLSDIRRICMRLRTPLTEMETVMLLVRNMNAELQYKLMGQIPRQVNELVSKCLAIEDSTLRYAPDMNTLEGRFRKFNMHLKTLTSRTKTSPSMPLVLGYAVGTALVHMYTTSILF